MALGDYNRKRNFDQTPEPRGEKARTSGALRFVVQLHAASRLHYDFRIEADGVLKSWAIPKGPSRNPQDQRLAVQVEDHPLAYGSFEGIIPKGNYGSGTVLVWDEGTYVERNSSSRRESEKAVLEGLEHGHITIVLSGHKLRGEFALIRLEKDTEKTGKAWLLIKKRDAFSSYKGEVTQEAQSVKTGRSLKQIAEESAAQGDVWIPKRTQSEQGPFQGKSQDTYRIQTQAKDPAKVPAPGRPSGHSAPDQSREKGSRVKVKEKLERLPHRVKPMLPVSHAEPFDQSGWLFEVDYGGYRTIAEIEQGSVHLHSKQVLSFNEKFPEVVDALRGLKISAVLDGEIDREQGGRGRKTSTIYWVRDLLHLNGKNLRDLPLIERKKCLEELNLFNEVVRYCPHELKKGIQFFERAVEEGHSGVLARDAYSLYQSGTSKRWLRILADSQGEMDHGPRFSHLDKVYWPKEKMTKGDLVEYYRRMSPFLLPHLKDRPESLHRFPDGIQNPGFFQKDFLGHHPKWVSTERVLSHTAAKSIDYLLCQNESTLLYMANLGCIELNPWLSRVGSLDRPDWVVIDLDPADENEFSEVIEIALDVHHILDAIGATHYCKTSGATGLHIYIPVGAKYSFEEGRKFAEAVCQVVHRRHLKNTSLERSPSKRRGKIYLDCYQNVQGQTVASIYSVRPLPGAPVSTPLQWKELKPSLKPSAFTIHNVPDRVEKIGDLWGHSLKEAIDLEACRLRLFKKFPNG